MNEDSIKKTISKNITKYRESAGLSQKEFAKRLNVAPSRVSNWETNANCPTIDILFDVCDVLGISINDIYGIYPDSKIRLSYDEINHIKKYQNLDTYGQKTVSYILDRETERVESIRKLDKHISELEKDLRQDDAPDQKTRVINYYYRLASAGAGQIIFDMPPTKRIEIPDIPDYRKADYAIGVNGNSMEPAFSDGDTLLVEMTDQVDVGEIGIFSVDNECYVKERGIDELISLNPESDNIPLNETAHCMGRVIGKLTNNENI